MSKIKESLITIFVGSFILHKSFDWIGFKKYNKYSVWGEE